VVLAEHQNFLAFISVNEAWSEEAAAEAEEMVLDAASAAEKLDPSPRLWDLTVMVLIAGKIRRGQMSSAMSWATSTRYARRLIVDGIDFDEDDDLRRALAPLLPLSLERSADSSLDLRRSLRERLSRVVGADLATTAVESFFDSGRIELR
jgi:hypothetical protein